MKVLVSYKVHGLLPIIRDTINMSDDDSSYDAIEKALNAFVDNLCIMVNYQPAKVEHIVFYRVIDESAC